MLPYLTKQAPWFAFLVHPRDVGDLDSLVGSRIVRDHSADEADFVRRMCSSPPLVAGEILFGFSAIRGELVSTARMPEQLAATGGALAVAEAAALAAGRGARVIGLGALTAPATGGGVRLLHDLPPGVTVTTGNAYTAAVTHHNVLEACAAFGFPGGARVAVLGCTGSVGGAACRLLAEDGFELVLIGRNVKRVRHLLGDLTPRASVHGDLDAARCADLVLVVTGDPTARLTPDLVKPGAVVIDVAQPANVSPEAIPDFRRRGVTVVQGGLVRIDGYSCTYDLRLPDPACTFACLAETYLFAREGIREHSVGRPDVRAARRMAGIAARHGVRPEPLRFVEAT